MTDKANTLTFVRGSIADALAHAATLAGRASELFDGEDEAVLFENMRNAISFVRDQSPEMKAISKAMHDAMRSEKASQNSGQSEEVTRCNSPGCKKVASVPFGRGGSGRGLCLDHAIELAREHGVDQFHPEFREELLRKIE